VLHMRRRCVTRSPPALLQHWETLSAWQCRAAHGVQTCSLRTLQHLGLQRCGTCFSRVHAVEDTVEMHFAAEIISPTWTYLDFVSPAMFAACESCTP